METILEELRRSGLLLLTDPALPSVAALVAGAPVRGSWWAHPAGRAIFAAASALADHPDVTSVKLVGGKVTFVHRGLWPALLAVATAREPWQTRGLPPPARALLERVRRRGELRTDALPRGLAGAAKLLEVRLLVHADEVHTESGAHARRLLSWTLWARQAGASRGGLAPPAGRRLLEAAADALSEGTPARLPWRA